MKVCKKCGSDRVFYDAWVDVNDPENVITLDDILCDECGVSVDIDTVDSDGEEY
tara:strand:- start:3815 stop:3976 length:162 start_codon:yes stop_codon:yes gene_type:complete